MWSLSWFVFPILVFPLKHSPETIESAQATSKIWFCRMSSVENVKDNIHITLGVQMLRNACIPLCKVGVQSCPVLKYVNHRFLLLFSLVFYVLYQFVWVCALGNGNCRAQREKFLIFFSVNSCVRCVCDLLLRKNFFWLFLGSVFCVHVSSQKSIAVSGGQDDVAYVWSLQTGNTVFRCTGRLSSVAYF